jgi:hypothetical protein
VVYSQPFYAVLKLQTILPDGVPDVCAAWDATQQHIMLQAVRSSSSRRSNIT